jgi:hypothetical protein
MIRQYGAQRHRLDARGRAVGTMPAGTVVRLDQGRRPWNRYADTVIVEGWIPRDYTQLRLVDGRRWHVTVRVAGGHLAVVRSLRNGRRFRIADHILLAALDD